MKVSFLFLLLLVSSIIVASKGIQWQKFNADVVSKAKKEKKIILLNLEANWCHWCHVMHDSTYSNPEIIDFVNQNFLPIKADQDAYPELSARYKDYGWPATIFIGIDGEDIVKRAGYMSPTNFLRLMNSILRDPSPEYQNKSFAAIKPNSSISPEVLINLETKFKKTLDIERGGFNQAQKYVDFDTYEYALNYSNYDKIETWLSLSESGAKKLCDPAWGGVYQYSTHFDWEHLHFEKLLEKQARYIKIFCSAYAFRNDAEALQKAEEIVKYCDRFLWNNGLYSNAQDADLVQGEHSEEYFQLNNAERIAMGIPKIDSNTFTNTNAEMAISLLKLYQTTGEIEFYNKGLLVLNNLQTRKAENGLYLHTKELRDVFSLRDNIAMAKCFLAYFKQDKQKELSNSLNELLLDIASDFKLPNGSFKSFSGNIGLSAEPVVAENIAIARIYNLFGQLSGNENFVVIAKNIQQFLTAESLVNTYYSEPAILSLSEELKYNPKEYAYMEFEKSDFGKEQILSAVPFYSNVTVYNMNNVPKDKKELFSNFDSNVLLVCTSNTCSAPITSSPSLIMYLKSKK